MALTAVKPRQFQALAGSVNFKYFLEHAILSNISLSITNHQSPTTNHQPKKKRSGLQIRTWISQGLSSKDYIGWSIFFQNLGIGINNNLYEHFFFFLKKKYNLILLILLSIKKKKKSYIILFRH